MKKWFKYALYFVWGFPQNIVGFLMYLYYKNKAIVVFKFEDATVVDLKNMNKNIGAVSLGQFIFLFSNYGMNEMRIIKHEYGHTRQSHILGPLYLLVVGLPSIIWNRFFKDYRRINNVDYYSVFPENWADKLGGVKK